MSQKNEVIQSTQQQTTEEAINRNTEGKEVKIILDKKMQ